MDMTILYRNTFLKINRCIIASFDASILSIIATSAHAYDNFIMIIFVNIEMKRRRVEIAGRPFANSIREIQIDF